jgi:hypothetical protein
MAYAFEGSSITGLNKSRAKESFCPSDFMAQ